MIEELDDIIEELADRAGAYGSHPEGAGDNCNCRVCFTSTVALRIRDAVAVEAKLAYDPLQPQAELQQARSELAAASDKYEVQERLYENAQDSLDALREELAAAQGDLELARLALAKQDMDPISVTTSGSQPASYRCNNLTCQLAGFHVHGCNGPAIAQEPPCQG